MACKLRVNNSYVRRLRSSNKFVACGRTTPLCFPPLTLIARINTIPLPASMASDRPTHDNYILAGTIRNLHFSVKGFLCRPSLKVARKPMTLTASGTPYDRCFIFLRIFDIANNSGLVVYWRRIYAYTCRNSGDDLLCRTPYASSKPISFKRWPIPRELPL
jgi:hypothetical protein